MFLLILLLCNVLLMTVSSAMPQTLTPTEDNNKNSSYRFRVIYEWKYINFTWPSEEVMKTSIGLGQYIPENVHISGLKYFEDYLYLSVPRMKEGVPATFTRIQYNERDKNTAPNLEPYPSWEMNTEGNCSALQNVQNIEIDPKGILYILDGGKTRTLEKTPQTKCPPRLIIYDIKANKLITSYTFPPEITGNGTFLYDLVVDDVDGGYLYITDNSAVDPAIIVYSIRLGRAWIIRDSNSMVAKPEASNFLVNGTAVNARINIAGIALGPRMTLNEDDHKIIIQDRTVYYCPLSSYRLYSINSAILRDESSAKNGIEKYVMDLGRKASQSDGIVMDENGVLYYGLLADSSVAKWDSNKAPFTSGQKVIARDRTYIQWPDSLAFDLAGNLLVVTNKLQRFVQGQMDLNQENYRILQGFVGAKSYLYTSTNNDFTETTNTSPPPTTTPPSIPSSLPVTTRQQKPLEVSTENAKHLYYDTHTSMDKVTETNTPKQEETTMTSPRSSSDSLRYQLTILLVAVFFMITVN